MLYFISLYVRSVSLERLLLLTDVHLAGLLFLTVQVTMKIMLNRMNILSI